MFIVSAKKKTADKKSFAPLPQGKSVAGATAAAILGIGTVRAVKKIRPEWQRYYNNLLELRDRLSQQMIGLAKESSEEMDSYSLHMADAGTDNFDRDFALSLLSSDQDAMFEIEEAIKRIEKDTYGTCEITGKPIPKARLDAIPWARFTVEAQAQLEKEGALRQRRLGQLGSVDASASVDVSDDDDEPEEKPAKEKE